MEMHDSSPSPALLHLINRIKRGPGAGTPSSPGKMLARAFPSAPARAIRGIFAEEVAR